MSLVSTARSGAADSTAASTRSGAIEPRATGTNGRALHALGRHAALPHPGLRADQDVAPADDAGEALAGFGAEFLRLHQRRHERASVATAVAAAAGFRRRLRELQFGDQRRLSREHLRSLSTTALAARVEARD